MKRFFFIGLLASVFSFFYSCSNSTEPDDLPDIFFETPTITGMIITGVDGPDKIAEWRHPLYPDSVEYPHSNTSQAKIQADVHPIPGSHIMDLENPYPNPSNGAAAIGFKVAVETRISLWMLKGILPEENPNGLENGSGGIFVSPNNETGVVFLDKEFFRPGTYLINFDGRIGGKHIPYGFYRIYFKADGHLFWRDIFIAFRKTDVPPDLIKYFNVLE